MKINSKTLIDKFDNVFTAMFNDKFIDKYASFFDELISKEKISIKAYPETKDIIYYLSQYIDNPIKISQLFVDLPCNIMFDIYYRYHILMEYLYNNYQVDISAYNRQVIFIDLFTKIWLNGISTFSCMNFQ